MQTYAGQKNNLKNHATNWRKPTMNSLPRIKKIYLSQPHQKFDPPPSNQATTPLSPSSFYFPPYPLPRATILYSKKSEKWLVPSPTFMSSSPSTSRASKKKLIDTSNKSKTSWRRPKLEISIGVIMRTAKSPIQKKSRPPLMQLVSEWYLKQKTSSI